MIEFWPAAYIDEVMDRGRASPSDWIEQHDGRPCLAESSDDDEVGAPWELADGEIIEFISCETLLETTLRLTLDGGFQLAQTPPPFGQCCVLDGWQSETGSETVDDMVESLRGADAEIGDYRVAFFTWSQPAHFRFVAATNSFEAT